MPTGAITVRSASIRSEIANLTKRMMSLEPALKRIGLYLVEVSQQAFDNESDPVTGQPWKPLSPKYKAWKEGRNTRMSARRRRTPGFRPRGTKILVLQGYLKRSIHSLVTGKKRVAVGTNVPYGEYHQYGTGKMPRRRFLGWNKQDEEEIRGIVARYVWGGER